MNPFDSPSQQPAGQDHEPERNHLRGWELTPEELIDIKRRLNSPGPFFFSDQVQDRLKALEKAWERTGGFDERYMKAFLARLAEEDPPHYVVRSQ
jgi:hypothetical protein